MGEPWFGFEAVRDFDGLPPEILLIPLRGHTEGHAGIAVKSDSGWLLHAGDAYLSHNQMLPRLTCTPGLAVHQHIMDTDRDARHTNQERLRTLAQAHDDIVIFRSHDTSELRLRQAASAATGLNDSQRRRPA